MRGEFAAVYLDAKNRRLAVTGEVLATLRAIHTAAEESDYDAAHLLAGTMLREVGSLRRRLQLEAIASEAIDGTERGAGE